MTTSTIEKPSGERKSYANGRVIHDADSHIFEGPGFYHDYLDPAIRERVEARMLAGWQAGHMFSVENWEKANEFHDDEESRADNLSNVMERKFWYAHGAFRKEDRTPAMDLLGFKSQLVYDSFMRGLLREYEQGDDMDVLYGAAKAHALAVLDFCRGDKRLIPAGYLPLADPARSVAWMKEMLDMGVWAVTLGPDAPKAHSPSHVDLEPVWAMAADAGVPFIYHLINGSGSRTSPAFRNNGRRKDAAFEGGDGSLTSFDYLCAPLSIIETLNAFVIDGVFERNPKLRIGIVEFGSTWVPGYLRFLDSAKVAYARIEERIANMKLKPSEYIQQNVRVAPYHFEETGWLIREAGPDIALFSSDYPHREGGRFPLEKFDTSLDKYGISPEDRDKFYYKNYEDMLAGWAKANA